MRRAILIVGAAELALFIATRLFIANWSAWEWQPEMLRTACRAGVSFVLWFYFRSVIFSGTPNTDGARHPMLVAAVGLLLAVPLLIGNWFFMGPFTRTVFAVTSIVVAIHEEFLFRGVVQTLLARRYGVLKAIGITSIIMTAWHVGALPHTFMSYWQVFAISCVLGLIYAKTQSMVLVVALHALYDAIWSLTPVLAAPLSWEWGAGLLLAALALTSQWGGSALRPTASAQGARRDQATADSGFPPNRLPRTRSGNADVVSR